MKTETHIEDLVKEGYTILLDEVIRLNVIITPLQKQQSFHLGIDYLKKCIYGILKNEYKESVDKNGLCLIKC